MQRSFKTGRIIWFTLALALLAGAVFAVSRAVTKTQVVMVHVASPTMQSISTFVTSNGRVVPVEDFQARAAFAGTVEKVFVHVGDKVTKGQLLIKMSDPFAPSRYASATAVLRGAEVGDENIQRNGSQEDRINMQSDLQRSQREVADAQKQLSLLEVLRRTGAASDGEIENAQHRLVVANESLDTLHSRMTRRYSKTEVVASGARIGDAKASLQTARLVLANANVVSTIPGTVYSLPVSTSDFIPMGAELMRVTDLSRVEVHAYIDEPNIGKLAVDEPVIVTWDAKPEKIWHGHVKQVPLTVSHVDTRVVGECVIVIENADSSLLPNANVAVDITTSKPVRSLTLPRGALRIEDKDSVVYRVIDGKLVRTKVQIGIVNTNLVQIVSGLSDKDVVAVTSKPISEFVDGLSVAVAP